MGLVCGSKATHSLKKVLQFNLLAQEMDLQGGVPLHSRLRGDRRIPSQIQLIVSSFDFISSTLVIC